MIFKKLLVAASSLACASRVLGGEGFEGEDDSLYGEEDFNQDEYGGYGGSPYSGMDGYGGMGGGDMGGYGGGMGGYGGGMGGYGGGMGGYGGGGYGGGYGGDGYGGGGQETPEPIPMRDIESVEQLQQFREEDNTLPLVVGYFDENSEEDKAIFDEVHSKLGPIYRFASVTSPDVLKESKYTCAVIVYKPASFINEKYEKPKARFPGKSITNGETLAKFIMQKTLPMAGHKTKDNAQLYEALSTIEVTVFADIDVNRNMKQFQYFANRLRKVAVDWEDKVVFNVAQTSDFEDVMDRGYGLELSGRNDVGVGLRDATNFYKMNTKFSTDNVRAFVESHSRGELAGLEQQQQEEHDEEGGDEYSGPSSVVTLTPRNFKELVTDSGKDVMVEFYAPWCGHCKSLKPEFDSASNQLKDIESVMLGAFDASEETVPAGFDVQGFPTLYFVPADKSGPLSYEGAREAKAMVKYIKKHATTEFSLD